MRLAQYNLVFRFVLELCSYIAIGFWGWHQADGLLAGTLALVIPLGLALIWGTFAVPNDPSRATQPAVSIPGWLRLIIEVLFFGFAMFSLFAVGIHPVVFWAFLGCLVLHHILSYRRLAWLVKQKPEKKNK